TTLKLTAMKITKQNVLDKVTQFNLEHLNHNRASINGIGWTDIAIDETFKAESLQQIVDIIGGRESTKAKVLHNLTSNKVNGWFMNRFIYIPKYDRWSYVAGQDYVGEIASIRRKLSTM